MFEIILKFKISVKPGQNSQFNYYNFESDLPDYSVFDTTGCHSPENVLNFRISFSYYSIKLMNFKVKVLPNKMFTK